MLAITTTKHQLGALISGDYNDLNELYDSLSRYLDFYQTNNEEQPYSEYEFLLSLNYDIRHAFQGNREYISVKNNAKAGDEYPEWIYCDETESSKETRAKRSYGNQNLYFGVEILYPLIFHYLVSFQNILNTCYQKDWFSKYNAKNELREYDILQADYDRAQIQLFIETVWKNLEEYFGKEETIALHELLNDKAPGVCQPAMYVDYLLHHQIHEAPNLNDEQRKQLMFIDFIYLSDLYEDRTSRYIHGEFRHAKEALKPFLEHPVWSSERFIYSINKFFNWKGSIYEDEFEKYLDKKLGYADWDMEM